jgi:hypothetical protein
MSLNTFEKLSRPGACIARRQKSSFSANKRFDEPSRVILALLALTAPQLVARSRSLQLQRQPSTGNRCTMFDGRGKEGTF